MILQLNLGHTLEDYEYLKSAIQEAIPIAIEE
jgi:hypothetical protein